MLNDRLFHSAFRDSYTQVGLQVLKKPSMCHLPFVEVIEVFPSPAHSWLLG